MTLSFLKSTATALVFGLACAGSAFAQDMFAPRLFVNDKVITEFEVMQRALFIEILGASGDPEEEALEALLEDRLRAEEAERMDVAASEEELLSGMEEFAGRANLTTEAFLQEIAAVGISAETYRDFVRSGLIWRKLVRAKFAGGFSVSDNEIDQALESAARTQELRVLVSELVIPGEGEAKAAALDLARQLSAEISGAGSFEAAARTHSKSPTAARGGRLDWMPLSNLPAEIGGAILALAPGEVSDPIVVPGAVVLFMLRDVAVDESAEPVAVTVEWAEFLVPDDAEEIARIRAKADNCYDLNGQAKGLPEDRLTVTTQPATEVPSEVGLELARLDPGEFSVALTRSGFRRLIMLCGREPTQEEPIDRELVREQLLNRKLELLAETYLEELRSAAVIRTP